eukprot:7338538-Prymnesium_polylepis.1
MRGAARTEAQAQQVASHMAGTSVKSAGRLREQLDALTADGAAAPPKCVVEHAGDGNLRLHLEGVRAPPSKPPGSLAAGILGETP